MNKTMPPLLAMALALIVTASGRCAADVHEKTSADGSRYFRLASQTTDSTELTFPIQGLACEIENEDATNALLVRFIRHNETVTIINASDGDVTAGELSAPSDGTWTQVQSIPPDTGDGKNIISFDVRAARGMIVDRAAGTGAFTVRLID